MPTDEPKYKENQTREKYTQTLGKVKRFKIQVKNLHGMCR
jgi:hypothetical protein